MATTMDRSKANGHQPIPPREHPDVKKAAQALDNVRSRLFAVAESAAYADVAPKDEDEIAQRLLEGAASAATEMDPVAQQQLEAAKKAREELPHWHRAEELATKKYLEAMGRAKAEYLTAMRPQYQAIVRRQAKALEELLAAVREEHDFRDSMVQLGLSWMGVIPICNVATVECNEITARATCHGMTLFAREAVENHYLTESEAAPLL